MHVDRLSVKLTCAQNDVAKFLQKDHVVAGLLSGMLDLSEQRVVARWGFRAFRAEVTVPIARAASSVQMSKHK